MRETTYELKQVADGTLGYAQISVSSAGHADELVSIADDVMKFATRWGVDQLLESAQVGAESALREILDAGNQVRKLTIVSFRFLEADTTKNCIHAAARMVVFRHFDQPAQIRFQDASWRCELSGET